MFEPREMPVCKAQPALPFLKARAVAASIIGMDAISPARALPLSELLSVCAALSEGGSMARLPSLTFSDKAQFGTAFMSGSPWR